MTSKEALEHICKTCDNKGCPYIHYEKTRCVYYGIIKQDLEILEIFKDNVMLDEDEKVITLFSKNKEVVNKVKEWLYRE